MDSDEKLDILLQDVSSIKTTLTQHSSELTELKQRLEPVFFHVTGMQWTAKLICGAVGLGTLIIGAIALMK